MNVRERIIAAMAEILSGHDAFSEAEEIARSIEEANRTSLADMFRGSLETDRLCGVEATPEVSTPEHFGACLVCMTLTIDGPVWWDNHHDFDLVLPRSVAWKEAV